MNRKKQRSAYIASSYIISSLGLGIEEHCKKIYDQEQKTTLWNNEIPIFKIAESCLLEKIAKLGLYRYSLLEQLAIIAVSEVIHKSYKNNINKTLLVLSTTKGNINYVSYGLNKALLYNSAKRINTYFGLTNAPIVVSNACISGVAAIIAASDLVKNGNFDNVIVVGVDVLGEFILHGFNSLKSLSNSICIPYDANRDGLTLGEACGALRITHIKCKKAIQIRGGAISNDANHISGPSKTGDGLAIALWKAMSEANLQGKDIDYINAHGTATIYNDEMESKAFKIHGLDNVPLNSLKPYIGHTLGASGVVETILCCEQMNRNIVYGIKGLKNIGVSNELNVSPENRNINITYAIKCTSGFGGVNAAIVLYNGQKKLVSKLKKIEVRSSIIREIKMRNSTMMRFQQSIMSEYTSLGEQYEKFYKMDNICKLGYIASVKLLKDYHFTCLPSEIALVLCNKSSSLDTDIKHQYAIDNNQISPSIFVYTLPNIVAGEIAIRHKIQGETSFFISNRFNSKDIRKYSDYLLSKGMKYVIYGWCELFKEKYSLDMKILKLND